MEIPFKLFSSNNVIYVHRHSSTMKSRNNSCFPRISLNYIFLAPLLCVFGHFSNIFGLWCALLLVRWKINEKKIMKTKAFFIFVCIFIYEIWTKRECASKICASIQFILILFSWCWLWCPAKPFLPSIASATSLIRLFFVFSVLFSFDALEQWARDARFRQRNSNYFSKCIIFTSEEIEFVRMI